MDENPELAELRTVSITEYFEHEEQDFTPWLARNIDLLSGDDLLNIPLEVQQTEASVGRYQADIIAEDPETDRTIVIENQFGETDHTHLGQSLVYTAGREADIVVWIAEEFNSEHISAFRWLNDRTDEEAAFFAIEVSLNKIEDSPYAPAFAAVERPDEWSNRVRAENLSETERKQLQFWNEYADRAREQGTPQLAGSSPSGRASHTVRIGQGGVSIRPTFRFRGNELIAMIRFRDGDTTFAGINKDQFERELENAVSKHSPTYFDANITDEIRWDEAEEGESYDNILLVRDDVDPEKQGEWPEYCDWLLEAAQLYEETLSTVLE
jgi:hypothetical protein